MPFGKRVESSSILSLTCCCRSSAFEPGIWNTASTTVGSLPNTAVEEYCSAPSSMRAMSFILTIAPARGIRAHHYVAELLGVAQAAGRIDLHLEWGALGRWGLPDLAGGDLDGLLGDRLLDVDRGDAQFGKLVRIQPYPHRIAPLAEYLHVADARHAL